VRRADLEPRPAAALPQRGGADDRARARTRPSRTHPRCAIASLLSKQTSSGGFGLWGPFSTSELWLDSYVTEFLLRAKAEGYEVPELAMTMALDNLNNQVAYYSDFSKGGEDLAYALYDLAAPAVRRSAIFATTSRRVSTASARRSPRPSSAPRSPSTAIADARRAGLRRGRRGSRRHRGHEVPLPHRLRQPAP
jgi:hypothetical protein